MTLPPSATRVLRRAEDRAIADFDKRLALVEQGNDLHAKAQEARWNAVQHSIDGLSTEVRSALTLINQANAEPAATPSGRQLLNAIEDTRKDAAAGDAELRRDVEAQGSKVTGHDTFISEARGALRLARFALGTSFVSVVGNIVLALVVLAGGHHP